MESKKYIQTVLTGSEFLKLRFFCDLTRTSMKEVLRRLVINFVSSEEFDNVGNYADTLYKLGNDAVDRLKTEKLKRELFKTSDIKR